MGLLTVIRKAKRKEKEMRLLMVGLDNAGKTTIVKRINGEDISTVSPTLGFNIKTMEYNGYRLNVWDVGGQKTIRSYWRNYYESTDGLIWVVDSADVHRMRDCAQELSELLLEDKLAGASLLIFANKQDLAGALPVERVAQELQLAALPSAASGAARAWHIVGCSAVSSEGLLEGFNWVTRDVGSRLYLLE